VARTGRWNWAASARSGRAGRGVIEWLPHTPLPDTGRLLTRSPRTRRRRRRPTARGHLPRKAARRHPLRKVTRRCPLRKP
jgi:hypothetical protein